MIVIGVVTLFLNPPISEAIRINGQGYGIVSKNIHTASLVIPDNLQDSSSSYSEGKLTLNDKSYSLKNIDWTIHTKKISFSADAGYFLIKASGKSLLNSSDTSIYQLDATTSKGDRFFVLAKVRNDAVESSTTSVQEPLSPVQTKIINKSLLLLVKQTERVGWKDEYKFAVRVFESKSNPLSDFYKTSGYVENIRITGKISDPDGQIIKTFNGNTQKFGYYLDSLIISDNARTGNYILEVAASGDGYDYVVQKFDFFINPVYRGPAATP
jgi:hypothetical protein